MIEIKEYISSTIKNSEFDSETHKLIVNFNSGSTYQFENVLTEDYQQLVDGESAGKAFNQYIKKYSGSKIESLTALNENAE